MSTDANSTITLRVPSKYSSSSAESSSSSSTFTNPPLDWLYRTWCVTHSTLSMWSRARNVRITYSPLPSHADSGSRPRVDDLVEYEKSTGKGGVRTVEGIDTAASESGSTGSWDWRGKGVLGFVTSHWEVLGWGEREVEGGGTERWAVTWFAPTLFTKEGIDLYSDRKEGMSPALAGEILAALKGLNAKELVGMVEMNMKEVEIKLPWMEK
ncbi:hypothetical protein VM1G_02984 [Cytospora mali]|uniref:Uncharacterized protein n=1 Tax=Cytospora mali TaxID=578113 RepID=A0A194VT67_CYTMA|nr:hypothetical protein VM1G_02984 [Valsa mali]